MKHRSVEQLTVLFERKPPHVRVLHGVRALRTHLSASAVKKNAAPPVSSSSTTCSSKSGGSDDNASTTNPLHVSVGKLRPFLLSLMKQQRAAAAQLVV